jgi:hypothetical protein
MAAGKSSKFKVPSSKLLQIAVLLNTSERIQLPKGDHDFELWTLNFELTWSRQVYDPRWAHRVLRHLISPIFL